MTSPTTFGLLPDGVSPVGGIVLDLVGQSGGRVVSQLNASSLFQGVFDDGFPVASRGNPGTIGIQEGFDDDVLSALGDGLAQLAVRLTVFDGDTGVSNFDREENRLLINAVDIGDFSSVVTEETTANGETTLSANPLGGFRNEKLDTGFFFTDDPDVLARVFSSLQSDNAAAFRLEDADPFDNFFDFTQGVDAAFADISQPPKPVNQPPQIDEVIGSLQADGRTVDVTVSAFDPDAPDSDLQFDFDFDNDGNFELTNQTGVATFSFSQDGMFPINVRVRDADGGEATSTIVVEARAPQPPQIVDVQGVLQADGRTVDVTVTAFDPDAPDADLQFDFDFDNDGNFELTNQTGVATFSFSEDGMFPVNVRVRDADGGEATSSIVVEALTPLPPAEVAEVEPSPPTPVEPVMAAEVLTALPPTPSAVNSVIVEVDGDNTLLALPILEGTSPIPFSPVVTAILNPGLIATSTEIEPQAQSFKAVKGVVGYVPTPMSNGEEEVEPAPPPVTPPPARGPPHQEEPPPQPSHEADPTHVEATPSKSAVAASTPQTRPSNGRVIRTTLALLAILIVRRRYKRSGRSIAQRMNKL